MDLRQFERMPSFGREVLRLIWVTAAFFLNVG